ncbi:hypothetical protein [Halioxenophilus sp. WMMB6]|uniref:hypothetical protein n=1 Tax=Halioxenophilus sp. WMMB6 TaxID=3073815 RepID=UPI00295E591D|nr:hypothetical protein [Halioxenophilus sp. WMMB6]
MRSRETTTQSKPLERLFARIPPELAESFSEPQRAALAEALASSSNHAIDFRPVVKIPLLPWSFYLVFLAGRNRRFMSSREQRMAVQTLISLLITAIVVLGLVGIVVLYLIKSALGIDLIKDFHWGIWFWFEDRFLKS